MSLRSSWDGGKPGTEKPGSTPMIPAAQLYSGGLDRQHLTACCGPTGGKLAMSVCPGILSPEKDLGC